MKQRPLLPLLLLLLSAVATLRAAQPPAEFLDIPWGAPAAEVKKAMLKRPEVKLKTESTTQLIYEGGAFANYPVERYDIDLTDGKFTSGSVFIVIPPGNGKDGAPLRNHQYEEFSKSLTSKYGKAVRTNEAKHTETNWIWPLTDKLSGQQSSITIHLSYSWEPYAFVIRYSNQPGAATGTKLKPAKKNDL